MLALFVWATEEDQCEITLSFNTSKAHWKPEYILSHDKGKITLRFLAKIMQTTGINWKDVDIALSSSKPVRSLSLPEIEPLFVYAIDNTQIFRSKMVMRAAPPRMEEIKTSVKRSLSSYSYTLATPVSLDSGKEGIFALKTFKWDKPKIERICVPSESEAVYVKVELPLPKSPLPNGTVRIIDEGTYVGNVQMSSLISGKTMVVPLGTDPEIEVKRKLIDLKKEKTWSGNNRVTATYKITLVNTKDTPVSVKLIEPLPVSKDDRVEVTILQDKITPVPNKIKKNGLATWILNLQPGKRVEITYSFRIQFPEKALINLDIY